MKTKTMEPNQDGEPLLLPLSLLARQVRSPEGTWNRLQLESMAWSFGPRGESQEVSLEATSNIVLSTAATLDDLDKADVADGELLREALRKLEESLEQSGRKQVLLVTCGPLPLRQYLWPAAARAKLELGEHYTQYLDLLKEFETCYARRSPSSSQCHLDTCQDAHCQHSPSADSSSISSTASSAYASMGDQHQQATTMGAAYCYCCPDYYSTPDLYWPHYQGSTMMGAHQPHHQQAPLEAAPSPTSGVVSGEIAKVHHQQQLTKSAKRHRQPLGGVGFQLEAILEFLSIESEPLEATAGDGCEKCHSLLLAATAVPRETAATMDAAISETTCPPSATTNNNDNPKQEETEEQQVRDGAHCSECLARANKRLVTAMGLVIERMLNEGHQFSARPEQIKRQLEVGLCDALSREDEHRVVRARGLPWQASEQDIGHFFLGLNIARGGVGLCLSRQGRRNGEALVRFESREHRNLALGRHKHFMGLRYIEVYRATLDDFLGVTTGYSQRAQQFLSRGAQVIVRMRGLPFSATHRQVIDFFRAQPNRCEVLGGEDGVLFVRNQEEKPTGDAFVLFATDDLAQRALLKHKQNIGARYVELFRSSISEMQQVLSMCQQSNVIASQLQLASSSSKRNRNSQQQQASAWPLPASHLQQQQQQHDATKPNVAKPLLANQVMAPVTWAQVATSSLVTKAPTISTPSSADTSETNNANQVTADNVVDTDKMPDDCHEALNHEGEEVQEEDTAEEDGEQNDATTTITATTNTTNEVNTDSSHSLAHSPISSLSAASTASSSYKSSHYYNGHHRHQQHLSSSQARYYKFQQQQQQQQLLLTNFQQQRQQVSQTTQAHHHHHPHPHYQHMVQGPMAHYAPFHFYTPPPPPPTQSQPLGSASYQSDSNNQMEPRRDCVRLRGLPFEAQVEDVLQFLGEHSRHILQQGVHMVFGPQGQPSGEAVVQMDSCQAVAEASQAVHKKVMQVGKKQRYIEVIPCSLDDLHFMLGLHLLPRAHHHPHFTTAHQMSAYFRPHYYGGLAPDGNYPQQQLTASGADQAISPSAFSSSATDSEPGGHSQQVGSVSEPPNEATDKTKLEPSGGGASYPPPHQLMQPYYPILYYYPPPPPQPAQMMAAAPQGYQ